MALREKSLQQDSRFLQRQKQKHQLLLQFHKVKLERALKKRKEKTHLLKSLNQTLTFNSINAKYANVHPTDHYGIKN